MKIAVFASGRGSNFKALVKAQGQGFFKKASIALLVTDNPSAGAIVIAKKAGIPVALVERKDYAGKALFEKELIRQLTRHGIRLIVLAGFMRMLSASFVRKYRGRIMNIHPALLPSFKGSHGIRDAFLYGVKTTGVTVHFVDEEMDHGPIILQQEIRIGERDTLASLEEKIHKVEHVLYPQAVKLYSEGRLAVRGRKVSVR